MTSITSSSCHSPVFISNYGFPPFKASLHLTILLLLLFCELNFEVQYPSHACTFITSSSLKEWSHEPTTCGVQLSTKHWAFLSCRILLKRKRKKKKSKRKMEGKKYLSTFHSFLWKFVREGSLGALTITWKNWGRHVGWIVPSLDTVCLFSSVLIPFYIFSVSLDLLNAV